MSLQVLQLRGHHILHKDIKYQPSSISFLLLMAQKEETAVISKPSLKRGLRYCALMSCYHPDWRAEVFQDISQQLHCKVYDLFIARAHTDSG